MKCGRKKSKSLSYKKCKKVAKKNLGNLHKAASMSPSHCIEIFFQGHGIILLCADNVNYDVGW